MCTSGWAIGPPRCALARLSRLWRFQCSGQAGVALRLVRVNSVLGSHWLFLRQDEAGAAAILATELDDALGGKAKQFRELQSHESEELMQVLSSHAYAVS